MCPQKEERDNDDAVASLDAKIKRTSAAFDKRVRSSASQATLAMAAEHDRQISQLAKLSNDLNTCKLHHGARMRQRRDAAALTMARSLTGLAESQWQRTCEVVRKLGQHVGAVSSWNALLLVDAPVAPTMPDPLASDGASQGPATSPALSSPSNSQKGQTSLTHQPSFDSENTRASLDLQKSAHSRNQPVSSAPTAQRDQQQQQPDSPHPQFNSEPNRERLEQGYFDNLYHQSLAGHAAGELGLPTALRSGPDAPTFQHATGALHSPSQEERDLTIRAPSKRPSHTQTSSMSDLWATHSQSSSGQSSATQSTSSEAHASPPKQPTSSRARQEPWRNPAQLDLASLPQGFVVESDDEASPITRESPKQMSEDQSLSRTSSIESTSSSRSFVARMRERYQEESAKSTYYKPKVSHVFKAVSH